MVTCTHAEAALQKLGLANNFVRTRNCAMNASMLAELKKKQSGESVDEPEPAPRLSSAAYAAAPGFTPCRPSSAQFTSPSDAAPLDDVATALLERPKRPTRTPSRKRVGAAAAAAPAAAGLLLGRRGSAVADPRIALAALSPALDADAPAAGRRHLEAGTRAPGERRAVRNTVYWG